MGLAILGDIMLGRYVATLLQDKKLSSLIAPVSPLLEGRQLVANLECVLYEPNIADGPAKNVRFRAPISAAEQLKDAGFSVLSLGNNHIFDFGKEGLVSTMSALDDVGISYTGAGLDRDAAMRAATITCDGRRIGFIAFSFVPPASRSTAGVAYVYDDTVAEAIRRVRDDVDFLIAMPHTGVELYEFPLRRDQNIYRKMIDLGVDLVVGNQSHCVQAMETYRDKPVYYSLGDCIFDHHRAEVWQDFTSVESHVRRFQLSPSVALVRTSLILQVDITGDALVVTHEPVIMLDQPGPHLLPEREKTSWLEYFADISARLAFDPATDARRRQIEECLLEQLRSRGIL